MKNILKYATINALGTALYVILVASFISFLGNGLFDSLEDKTVLIPVGMLMLLVFSVALVGALIFGKPIVWYLEDKKKEAVLLLLYTLGIFFIMIIIIFLLLISLVI